MKGKLISVEKAILEIFKDSFAPARGCYQVEVKVDSSVKVTENMVGKTFEFEIKIPCMPFCGRGSICSFIYEKVCEESTCFPGKELDEIFILKESNVVKPN